MVSRRFHADRAHVGGGVSRLYPNGRSRRVALIYFQPLAALPLLAVAVVKSRKLADRTPHPEVAAALLRSVASELRAGRSLRVALVDCARLDRRLGLARVVRVAAAGKPMEQVADEVAACPGMSGLATALRVAAMTGRVGGAGLRIAGCRRG